MVSTETLTLSEKERSAEGLFESSIVNRSKHEVV